MSAKHTPGPWKVRTNPHNGDTEIVGAGEHNRSEFIALAGRLGGTDRYKRSDEGIVADARLIAAAPDLLAALLRAREFLDNCDTRPLRALEIIDAAIAKATGEPGHIAKSDRKAVR